MNEEVSFVLSRGSERGAGGARIPAVVLGVALVALAASAILLFRTGDAERGDAEADRADRERPELRLERTADYDYDPPVPGSYRLPEIKPAGDGAVLSASGEPRTLRGAMAGRIALLSFIYTRCADPTACPYATGVLYDIHAVSRQDAAIAKNLRLITFSFDPEHDTPRIMDDYGRALGKRKGSEWLFLTTRNRAALEPILAAYGQRIDRRKDPRDPRGPYSHVLRVYLIDRQGMIRNIYSSGLLDPRMVLTDVRTLLIEEGAAKGQEG